MDHIPSVRELLIQAVLYKHMLVKKTCNSTAKAYILSYCSGDSVYLLCDLLLQYIVFKLLGEKETTNANDTTTMMNMIAIIIQ